MSHSAARRDAGQIDEIVEPRRRPAECGVTLVLMADHAVGGVDRLVDRAADEAARRGPQDRRDDPIGEILGQALDRRAGHARLVQHLRIAPDDVRDRAASLVETSVEPLGDRAHVSCKAALRRQARGEKHKHDEAERPKRKKRLHRQPRDERDRSEKDPERDDAERAARGETQARSVHQLVQPAEPAAHPSDGMANRAIERRRIADQRLEDRGGERERQRK